MKAWTFFNLIRARGMSLTKLARLIQSNHAHLSQVINGMPGRGGQTRRKLAAHLTREETEALGWEEKGTLVIEAEVQTPVMAEG